MIRRKFVSLQLLALFLLGQSGGCVGFFSYTPHKSHARMAEQLAEKGQYEQAINEYHLHIQQRLAYEKRPQTENPYFYYLLIGDIYLEQGDARQARSSYEIALEKKVMSELVNERFRNLGKWYEERQEYELAIEVLQEYRELDPLMFDYDIDRIHKEMVQREQKAEQASDQDSSLTVGSTVSSTTAPK